jgi:hypothetical protein
MELFKYLKEEDQMLTGKLETLIADFPDDTREKVFDSVKAICDAIRASVDKKSTLITAHLGDSSQESALKEEAIKDRVIVLEEIESLVMVHVDEPGFRDILRSLLKRYQSHCRLWDSIEQRLLTILPPTKKNEIAESFKNFSHGLTGFNVLPAEPGKSPDALEREGQVKVESSPVSVKSYK